jgi:hypothetical protein
MQNRHTGYFQESLKQNPGLEAFEKGRGKKDGIERPLILPCLQNPSIFLATYWNLS